MPDPGAPVDVTVARTGGAAAQAGGRAALGGLGALLVATVVPLGPFDSLWARALALSPLLALPLALALPRRLGAGAGLIGAVLAAGAAAAIAASMQPTTGWPASPGHALLERALRERAPLALVVQAALALAAALPLLVVRRFDRARAWQVAAGLAGGLAVAVPASLSHAPPHQGGHALLSAAFLGAVAGTAQGLVASWIDRDPAPSRRPDAATATLGLAILALVGLGAAFLGLRTHLDAARDAARIEALLAACAASQARYRDAHGRYPDDLRALELAPADAAAVGSLLCDGYVLRYATAPAGQRWALAADPIPGGPGRPHLVVSTGGALRRAQGPVPLAP